MSRSALLALALAGCAARGPAAPRPASARAPAPAGPARLADVPREAFNANALALGLPLFWSDDRNGDGALEPDELAVIWGLDPRPRAHWVEGGAFTPAFLEAYARIRAGAPAPSDARHAALAKELAQSYFTVLESDFRGAPPADRALVSHVLAAARILEDRLYARQRGTFGMAERIPASDGRSRLVFFLNQGPWCSAPTTERDPACTAIDPAPPRRSGLYPADLQASGDFCAALARAKDHDALTAPFSVVVHDGKGLAAVPYSKAYAEDMAAVRRELEAAAAAIHGTGEDALEAYLRAAARAFGDDDWYAADEAYARMTSQNSRWFLRVAPDEVYAEPCNLKAGFHLTFARVDRASLAWQERLEPVKNEMERALAALAGPPYAARAVSFHLPDFIDVVLNAGDARDARGATVGQSLPNWGPVANEGRGRTVAMTNFYEDPESRRVSRARASSLLCPETMARYADDPDAIVLGTVLHEAAHNLGPAHEYAVDGKTDEAIFGGPLASTLEELKAQTSALYLTEWLAARGVLSRDLAERGHVRDLTWTFGHIARGMADAQGKIKPYSALAAIQVGFLLEDGALAWRDAPAANGTDRGCLALDFARFPASVEKLERIVLGAKARGDLGAANALVQAYVGPSPRHADVLQTITERIRRYPTASFLYSVRTE